MWRTPSRGTHTPSHTNANVLWKTPTKNRSPCTWQGAHAIYTHRCIHNTTTLQREVTEQVKACLLALHASGVQGLPEHVQPLPAKPPPSASQSPSFKAQPPRTPSAASPALSPQSKPLPPNASGRAGGRRASSLAGGAEEGDAASDDAWIAFGKQERHDMDVPQVRCTLQQCWRHTMHVPCFA